MAPLPPLIPPPPERPGTQVRVRSLYDASDETAARQDAAEIIFAKLRAMIAAGTQPADAILGTVAVAAHALTEASGAAIAMPRDGTVVCVGRSGETAPELGTRLNVDSGISGECLRTGVILRCDDAARDFKVDSEVCRQLGLQSIAVVPLRGRLGRVGVLEVFSTQSYAFTEEHMDLLGRLAGLAEAAWAGASTEPRVTENPATEYPVVDPVVDPVIEHPPSSERVDQRSHSASAPGALQQVGEAIAPGLYREPQAEHKWNIGVVAGLSVSILLLLSVIGWRIWYKASIESSPRRPVASLQVDPADAGNAVARAEPALKSAVERPVARPSANSPSAIPKTQVVKSTAVVKMRGQTIERSEHNDANTDAASVSPAQGADLAPSTADIPEIAAAGAGPSDLGSVLSAPQALPKLGTPISQGMAGGIVVHKVQPTYPPEAREARLDGTVILEATVTEHGLIEDLKLVSGEPILAQAAMEAVSKWRYTPYMLNGKPISKQTRITVNFIAP